MTDYPSTVLLFSCVASGQRGFFAHLFYFSTSRACGGVEGSRSVDLFAVAYRLAALDGQGLCLFTLPGDGVRQRAEAWAKEAADLYCRPEKNAAASEEVGYQFHELLFRARLRLPESETVLRRVTQTNLQSTTDCH